MTHHSLLHRPLLPPVSRLTIALAFGIGVFAVVTLLAHLQPWLGLKLAAADGGAQVLVSKGPSAKIPEGVVLTIVEGGGERLRIESFDLTIEPDGAMGDYATYRRFLDRQDQLARIQSSEEVIFTAEDGQRFLVKPSLEGRPLTDLPVDFWVQCSVGMIAWLVSAAVFAFRRGDVSARYLLLSGASTLLFAPAAAVYTTRELAVPGNLLQWASDLNFLGGSLFAASFVAVLLVYPRKIGPAWTGPAVIALFVIWFFAQQVGVFESMTFARRFLVMIGVAATFILAGWHWRTSNQDPLARAKLQWFLLSWVVGTGVFALFILLPQTFGVDTSPIQGYAFLLFLLVYSGLAMGILRYRLFELGDWWRRVITWTLSVLFFILLDLLFLIGLSLSAETSLVVTLLTCSLIWIPLRSWVWHRFTNRTSGRTTTDLFPLVIKVALAPNQTERTQIWRELLTSAFEPLEIVECTSANPHTLAINDDGLSLALPPVGPLSGIRLGYARGGRSLFGPRDLALANELIRMLEYGLKSVDAYGKGVLEERGRIARDMHDNIGAILLSALYSADTTTKDLKIRESLTDLRKVINETPDKPRSIGEALADLRIETAERLDAAGIRFSWNTTGPDDTTILATTSHTLRSIIREAASNTIRHSEASEFAVSIQLEADNLYIEVQDNGKGIDPEKNVEGHGVNNMRTRLAALDGSFNLRSSPKGTTLEACLPNKQIQSKA